MKMDLDNIKEVTEGNMTENLPTWFLWDWPGCEIPDGGREPGPLGLAAYYVWAIAPPLLVMFGTMGNVLTVLIIALTFRRIRSVDAMLITLAVSDTAVLWSIAFRNWLIHLWGIDIRGAHDFVCKFTMLICYCSFQYSAVALVILTGERVMCILRPYSVYAQDNRKRVLIVASGTFVFLMALNSHLWFGFSTSPDPRYNSQLSKCGIDDLNYFVFLEKYYHWVHFVVGYSLPCALIVLGNVLIIRSLWKNRFENEPSAQNAFSRQMSEQRDNQRKSTTIMLVSLNVMFFVTQTPAAILLAIGNNYIENANKFACSDFATYKHRAETFNIVQSLIHTFVYFNSAVNFLLYVQSGSKFRTHARVLLTCSRKSLECMTSLTHTDNIPSGTERAYVVQSSN